MTSINDLIKILDSAEKEDGDHEPGYISQWPEIRDDIEETDEVKEQDKRFIRAGKVFAEEGCLNDEYFDIAGDDVWYWNIARIVEGHYPLKKIPEHVREIAREMYY